MTTEDPPDRSYYRNAPGDLVTQLFHFRETHPTKKITVDNVEWSYIRCGEGGDVILWLVGGLRVADAAFRSIPLLENAFEIIAPDYPPMLKMEAMVDGLAGILKAENIARVHVLGGSFGGMVAQVFVRTYPSLAHRIILSTTSAPDSQMGDQYQLQLEAFADLPDEMLRAGAKQTMSSILSPKAKEADFWEAYLDELYYDRLAPQHLISTYSCLIDYMKHYDFQPSDLAGWSGEMLILGSEDDAVFDREQQSRLLALYPNAITYLFQNAGHSPSSTQRDLYFRMVREFLQGEFV